MVLLGLPALAQAQAVGFPRAASFKDTNASGFALGGSATLTNYPADDGALRLTDAVNNQAGYAIDNQSFVSTQGFSISFEFFSYGTTTTPPADGFSVFLVDADGTTPGNGFSIGAVGGSLGYAQRNNEPGVTKGYLGIGIDEFGNYGIASEAKTGGYPGLTTLLPNAVSLRGPYNSADVSRTTGYTYLAGSNTLPFNLAVGTSPTNPGSRITNPNSPDYRKAYINVIPVTTNGSIVYKITIRIQNGQSVTTAVNNVLVTNPPTSLRVGFSGSTGGNNSIHEIRGLAVVQAPIAVDDNAQTAYNQATTVSILNNDTSSGAAIDPATVDLDPSTVARETSYTVANEGTFTVDNLGVVTFTPLGSFAGTITIPYTVQNKNQDISNPGTITMVVEGAEVATVVNGPSSMNPGQTATFSVNTTNNGQLVAQDVMPVMTLPAGFTVVGTLPTGATMATDNNGITTINFASSTLAAGESAVNTVQVLVAPTLATGNYNVASDYAYPSGAVIPDAVASNNASTLSVAVVTPMPLPVQLITFTAVAVGADARLNWGTAQETNNHHFEVERSLDGYSFSTINTVAGKGTTALLSTYCYLDAGASAFTTNSLYYRLRQVDYDGKASFSPVQAIYFYHADAGVVLYPNPTTGSTTLDLGPLPTGDYTVQVFEATGRLVHQATYQPGQRTLPLEGLATGTYFVKVQGNRFNKVLLLSRQ
ncbi:MAG: T9SS type A sorting domain-containing protein [Hymenobacter sp.]|nr:MAG: T9SS type A sorting domain-containing protein [Hymenobacter sp.]